MKKRLIDPDTETAVEDISPEECAVLAFAHAEEARRLLNEDTIRVGISAVPTLASAHALVASAYAAIAALA